MLAYFGFAARAYAQEAKRRLERLISGIDRLGAKT
jgi:hypothetical protein